MTISDTVTYHNVQLTDGFWKNWQKVNKEHTMKAVYGQAQQTGRFKSLEFDWSLPKDQRPKYTANDSGIAKWIEGAAYILQFERDTVLEATIDKYIDALIKRQAEDGYFNSHYQLEEIENRFTDYTAHELYMLGHLIEAAIAYYDATGKDALMRAMQKYVKLVDRVFRIEHSAAFDTPGHEEVELALYRLYQHTGDERALVLLRYFIDTRGYSKRDKTYSFFGDIRYAQGHLPVREQDTAEGHAVRAVYLYCAMADIAWHDEDETLKTACERVLKNIIERRLYITGGIGSCHIGESFTFDFDLMNRTAYTETCAAIGFALFLRRMSIIEPLGKYADTAELAIYNGTMAGISLDGESFFYENPLEVLPSLYYQSLRYVQQDHMPAIQRQRSFDCPCCPPNIFRFIGEIGDFAYSESEDTLFVHHYMASDTSTRFGRVKQRTGYPFAGDVEITLLGASDYCVAMRIPGWAKTFALTLNGQTIEPEIKQGYAYVERHFAEGDKLRLSIAMDVRLVQAHPAVHEDCGRVAVMRGPLVYCLEQVDNGANLKDISISRSNTYALEQSGELGMPALKTTGLRRKWPEEALYLDQPVAYERVPILLVPYCAWGNRGEGEMIVWTQER